MTGMQKRHFELGASIVRDAQPHMREALADAFVQLFRAAPRFDAERFRAACAPKLDARATKGRQDQADRWLESEWASLCGQLGAKEP